MRSSQGALVGSYLCHFVATDGSLEIVSTIIQHRLPWDGGNRKWFLVVYVWTIIGTVTTGPVAGLGDAYLGGELVILKL